MPPRRFLSACIFILASLMSLYLSACSQSVQNTVFHSIDITDNAAFKAELNFDSTQNPKQKFNIQASEGKIRLITFGYTSCPDYCPGILSKIKQIESKLPKDSLQVIFVTVDPRRDHLARLKEYLAVFNPNYIGLMPAQEELESLKKSFKIAAEQDGEWINHTTGMYIMDKKNRLRLYSPYNLTVQNILDDINKL